MLGELSDEAVEDVTFGVQLGERGMAVLLDEALGVLITSRLPATDAALATRASVPTARPGSLEQQQGPGGEVVCHACGLGDGCHHDGTLLAVREATEEAAGPHPCSDPLKPVAGCGFSPSAGQQASLWRAPGIRGCRVRVRTRANGDRRTWEDWPPSGPGDKHHQTDQPTAEA